MINNTIKKNKLYFASKKRLITDYYSLLSVTKHISDSVYCLLTRLCSLCLNTNFLLILSLDILCRGAWASLSPFICVDIEHFLTVIYSIYASNNNKPILVYKKKSFSTLYFSSHNKNILQITPKLCLHSFY